MDRVPEVRRRRRAADAGLGSLITVGVDLIEDETGWSPYLTVDDGCKLDEVRMALRRGDVKAAAEKARVYELRPVATQ